MVYAEWWGHHPGTSIPNQGRCWPTVGRSVRGRAGLLPLLLLDPDHPMPALHSHFPLGTHGQSWAPSVSKGTKSFHGLSSSPGPGLGQAVQLQMGPEAQGPASEGCILGHKAKEKQNWAACTPRAWPCWVMTFSGGRVE